MNARQKLPHLGGSATMHSFGRKFDRGEQFVKEVKKVK